MTTALDLIKTSLRRINSYQSGETIAPPDEQDCLETLNDMLDSWSTDNLQVMGSEENIFLWTPGKAKYTVGNPLCTDLGLTPFLGTLTLSSNVITGVTSIPLGLVAGTSLSSVGAGSGLTDLQNLLPVGTYVTAIGATTVTMSAAAKANSVGLDQFTYSLPGDLPMARPLRITDSYTRINQLDFTLDVYASQEEYNAILYKAQAGPWPTIAWYNNTVPYGTLMVYMTPSQSGELHLFTDTLLSKLTLNQTLILPQGYSRALKWNLAREICSEYGYPLTEAIKINAKESLDLIKALNAKPAQRAKYDRELSRGNRPDGGWILTGGYQ